VFSTLLLVQLAAALFMTGLIWFVQVVHYPLMAAVGEQFFVEYERRHQQRVTYVVALPMLLEGVAAVGCALAAPHLLLTPRGIGSAILLLAIWMSTALWQVPLHTQLARRYDPLLIDSLVASNWLRTFSWTVRALILLSLVFYP
jgi:hypothetical protein